MCTTRPLASYVINPLLILIPNTKKALVTLNAILVVNVPQTRNKTYCGTSKRVRVLIQMAVLRDIFFLANTDTSFVAMMTQPTTPHGS